MRKLFAKLKTVDKYHYIAIAAIAVSALAMFFFYPLSLDRAATTAVDLLDAARFWFLKARRIKIIDPARIADLPQVDLSPILPFSVEELLRKVEAFGPTFFDGENFRAYCIFLAEWLSRVALYIAPVFILLYCLWQLFKAWIFKPTPAEGFEEDKKPKKKRTPKEGENTRVLTWYLKVTNKIFPPVRDFVLDAVEFYTAHKIYVKIFVTVWLVNLNVVTILGSALALYFYFVSSFSIPALLVFAVRLLMDVLIMLSGAPVVFWLFVSWRLVCKFREYKGYTNLERAEKSNREFVGKLPVFYLAEGWMGSGKTTMITGIKTTAAIKFRRDALDSMLDIDTRFPHFPWAVLWKDLRQAVESGEICNPTPAERWMQRRYARFYLNPCPQNIWGYDYERYPMEFNDGLKIEYIWDALQDYAKLYFVYFVNSSLCFANYSIREDFVRYDIGHLPMWDTDLFHRDPRRQCLESRYCHIFDFDMIRLGVKMVKDNKFADALEIGVLNWTEIGKDQGNQETNKRYDRKSEVCNPLNDGVPEFVKMFRHRATIRNVCYAILLGDEQRMMSLLADMRETSLVGRITEKGESRVLLPLFTYAEMLYDFFWSRYLGVLREYYAVRGDMCLPIYLYKTVCCFFFARHIRAVNTFGCNVQIIETERGSMDGVKKQGLWYLLWKKDYSNVFTTDCLKGIHRPRLVRAQAGLPHVPEYKRLMAAADELAQQHSHFIENTKKAG